MIKVNGEFFIRLIKNPPRDYAQGGLLISVLRFLQEEFRLLIVGLLAL